MLQSRTDAAIIWCEKARNASPEPSSRHAYLSAGYALEGRTEHAAAELAAACRLGGEGRLFEHRSLEGRWHFVGITRILGIDALFGATLFAGLRKAGMPEE
jgi:hypothetical protein